MSRRTNFPTMTAWSYAVLAALLISHVSAFSTPSRSRTSPGSIFSADGSQRKNEKGLCLTTTTKSAASLPSSAGSRRFAPTRWSLSSAHKNLRFLRRSTARFESVNGGSSDEPVKLESEDLPISPGDSAVLAGGTASGAAVSPVSSTSTLPTYRKLIVFTATTILIWLSEPLLSLVDTTIVGMKCRNNAVLQIAALGPATMLYDSAIYLTYFLAIATTNQLAPALAKKDYKKLRQTTSHVLGLATVFGTLVTLLTFFGGSQILSSLAGETAVSSPAIVPLAKGYACIRASVAPLCVVGFVAQSFCLACLDTTTPAVAVAAASVVNVIGDWAWSGKYGIAGAAGATALATVTSTMILLRKVRKTTGEWRDLQAMGSANLNGSSNTKVIDGKIELVTNKANETSSTEGDAKPKPAKAESSDLDIPFASLPDRNSLIDLVKLGGPIFFVMMGKIACYSVMTLKATSLGIIPLAAHNIMMRVFFFYACFGDSLSQAAQSFYPSVHPSERKSLLRRLAYLSTWVGVWNAQFVVQILKRLGGYLTKDAAISGLMGSHTGFIAGAVLLHPFIMLLEGTVLATRDLFFLVAAYALTMGAHFGFVFSPLTTTFAGVWRALFVFQCLRLGIFGTRTILQQMKKRKGAPAPVGSEA